MSERKRKKEVKRRRRGLPYEPRPEKGIYLFVSSSSSFFSLLDTHSLTPFTRSLPVFLFIPNYFYAGENENSTEGEREKAKQHQQSLTHSSMNRRQKTRFAGLYSARTVTTHDAMESKPLAGRVMLRGGNGRVRGWDAGGRAGRERGGEVLSEEDTHRTSTLDEIKAVEVVSSFP